MRQPHSNQFRLSPKVHSRKGLRRRRALAGWSDDDGRGSRCGIFDFDERGLRERETERERESGAERGRIAVRARRLTQSRRECDCSRAGRGTLESTILLLDRLLRLKQQLLSPEGKGQFWFSKYRIQGHIHSVFFIRDTVKF